MSHVRQRIREAVATALTGLTTTGNRVYQTRVQPIAESKLPCLLVNTDSESVEALNISAPAMLMRTLDINIRAIAKMTANLDDTLDTIAVEVETALGNTTLSGLVKSLVMTGINTELDGEADRPVGTLTIAYRAEYMTLANAPQAAL